MSKLGMVGKLLRQKTVTIMILLSIIPVLGFGTLIYYMGIHIVKAEVNRSSQISLRQLSEQMDRTILQVEQVSGQLSLQSNIEQFANIRATPSLGALTLSNDLIRDLKSLRGSIEDLDTIYLYHFEQNMVVTPESIATVDDDFVDNQWISIVQQAGQERKTSFWMFPRLMNLVTGERKPVLTFVRMMPLFYEKPKAAMLVNVSLDRIRTQIGSFPLGSEGSILIFNKDGSLLVKRDPSSIVADSDIAALSEQTKRTKPEASTSTVKTAGGEMYLTSLAAAKNGFIYMMLIRTDAPNQNVRLLQKLIVGLTIAQILLALFSSYFSYSRFQKGVRRIVHSLFKNEQGAPETPIAMNFHYEDNVLMIENHISYLLKEVDDIRIRWQEQLPQLRDHFLVSALLGNADSPARLGGKPENAPSLFKHPYFAVILVQMDAVKTNARFAEEDEALFLFAAANIGRDILAPSTSVETIRIHRQAALIVNVPEETQEADLIRMAETLRLAVKQYLKQTTTVSVGKITGSFDEISLSYQEALRLLQSNWVRSSDEVLSRSSSGMSFSRSMIQYPYQIEKALLDCVAIGDADGAATRLEEFADALDRYQEPSFQLIQTFYLQLFLSLLRFFQDHPQQLEQVLGDGNKYLELLQLDHRDAVVDWLNRRIIAPFIAMVKQERTLRTKSLVERTKRLIEERYAQDLSLSLAAELLGTSPANLSRQFKEQMDENFILYVTKYRIAKTKQLLEQTELSVADISEEVGYGNAQQLIRVFKKLEGLTPGEYRNARKH